MAPEESLFSIGRHQPLKKTDRNSSLDDLTENLVIVAERAKIVIVEGKTDTQPYSELAQAVSESHSDLNVPKLLFRNVKEGGGGQSVIKLTEILGSFDWLVAGIVDGDSSAGDANAMTSARKLLPKGVHKLERYSIENYLYDPILVFAVLLHVGDSAAVAHAKKLNLGRGEVFKIRDLDQSGLQSIIDFIGQQIFGPPDKTFSVKFGGRVLQYPLEFITTRGHEYQGILHKKLSGRNFRPSDCVLMLHTVKLLPDELVSLFGDIARSL